VSVVGRTLVGILQIYVLVLLARIVFDYVFMLSREWRPRGVMLVVIEGIYTVTDPPIRFLRRFIPPVRIGRVSFDIAILVLFLLLQLLIFVAARF
jgi:YggT family protein